jgi:DNA-binding IclR family transcriptional regulator
MIAKGKKADQYFSRAVEKAMLALDCIRKSPQPLSLLEISAVLGLTKASAFRLLYTLEALGHLSKSPDGRYFATLQPTHRDEMVRHSTELLERLTMEFGETVSLAALFENHIEVLAVFESPQMMRMGNTLGRILPPNASSLGKAITAFQPPEITERLVRSYGTHYFTPNTITDEITLRDEFAQIREQGFAEDLEESALGGRCFAAPILAPNKNAVGAVSLSMPLIRFRGEDQRKVIVAAVREAAKAIQKRLN